MEWPWTRRRTIIAGTAIALLLLVVFALRPSRLDVETAVAERAELEVLVEEDGRTRAVDRYVVTAPVAGQVERIDAREGAVVQRGDVVARIQPMPLDAPTESALRAALTSAEARRAAASAARDQVVAALAQARREVERRRELVEQGALAAEQLEQYVLATRLREDELRSADQAMRAAAADVEAARAALLAARTGTATGSAVAVRAPADGLLLRVPERSARVVAAGTPLVEIGDPGALEVVVDVLTMDAVRVQPGMRATLRNWGGPPLAATVRTLEPSAFTRISALGVEEQRVNVILDLGERPAELGDGYRVDAAISVWSGTDILAVPTAALFRTGTGWSLFTVDGGRARLREVRVGERSGTRAQVLAGIEAGDTVVLFPPDALADGDRVRARD
ncbi:MAG TPA: efflux RND transporter periplasmic adaptor subunit [Longimicrobiales bacterium]|nr:efflux RND transporter periplasmic adaptor subunit [Longimicrobiales bacterium]